MEFNPIYIVLVVIIVAYFVIRLRMFRDPVTGATRPYNYRLKPMIMTPHEQRCFTALVAAVGTEYYICPQIPLDSFLDGNVPSNHGWWTANKYLGRLRSIDFLVCRHGDTAPLLAIELDDIGLELPDHRLRDQDIEMIFRQVGLPLLRLDDKDPLDTAELSRKIKEIILK